MSEQVEQTDDGIELSELTEDNILLYTQKTRKELAVNITKAGIPTDKDDRAALLQTLRDMDHTALTSKRLNTDEKALTNEREAQQIVKQLMAINPHGLRLQDDNPPERDVVVNAEELPKLEFQESQKQIGLSKDSSKEFLSRMDDQMQEEDA